MVYNFELKINAGGSWRAYRYDRKKGKKWPIEKVKIVDGSECRTLKLLPSPPDQRIHPLEDGNYS